jgi:hypothetical protein
MDFGSTEFIGSISCPSEMNTSVVLYEYYFYLKFFSLIVVIVILFKWFFFFLENQSTVYSYSCLVYIFIKTNILRVVKKINKRSTRSLFIMIDTS